LSNFRSGDCATDRIRASRDGNAYHIANEAKLRVDEYSDRLGIAQALASPSVEVR
jgi:hypothetical protein